MSRFRLYPDAQQEQQLLEHCAHARYVWNLCIEQESHWRPGRGKMPGFVGRCRELTEARAENPWLAEGPQVVQQQAIRDHDQAMVNFFNRTHGYPTWRKSGQHEGFRIVGRRGKDWKVRRISRHVGEIRIPKIGWVRFRWSRPVPDDAKSFRVTRDRARRWYVVFPLTPEPIAAPGCGEIIGIDRGVTASAALSSGEMLLAPGLSAAESARLRRLQRKISRSKRGSGRRDRTRLALVKLRARETDRRKDWAEKVSTDIARRFDVIRVEDLNIRGMTRSAKGTIEQPGRNIRQKAGLNRSILGSGWGLLVRRLKEKAPGRVEKINPRFTSQRCSACGHVASESRESQALFRCVACNFACNADVNAAKNIAAGHAVTAREGDGVARPVNREPQCDLSQLESWAAIAREDAKSPWAPSVYSTGNTEEARK